MTLLGEMVHAFLATDEGNKEKADRLAMATDIRNRYDIHALTPDAMLDASDRLAKFISQQYPDILSTHKEWPSLAKRFAKSFWLDRLPAAYTTGIRYY